MTETDTKKQREVEYVQKYTLTDAEKRKLILEKLERARVYHEAWKKREALFEESR